ncbi:MAG: NAD(P)H-hydrate dehydratase, partial [Anaerovoracaceae bacterium]
MEGINILDEKDIRGRLKPRPKDSHKGTFGRLLIFAGSLGMAGAAILCGKSALRSGVGLAQYAVPKELFPILQVAVPEATCIERERKTIESLYDAMAIGPGLGEHRGDGMLMKEILQDYLGNLVLDADGLNNILRFSLKTELQNTGAKTIITPHPGEAARLLGLEKIIDREKTVLRLARELNVIAILKGQHTLIATPQGEVYQNPTGNSGMATGGS